MTDADTAALPVPLQHRLTQFRYKHNSHTAVCVKVAACQHVPHQNFSKNRRLTHPTPLDKRAPRCRRNAAQCVPRALPVAACRYGCSFSQQPYLVSSRRSQARAVSRAACAVDARLCSRVRTAAVELVPVGGVGLKTADETPRRRLLATSPPPPQQRCAPTLVTPASRWGTAGLLRAFFPCFLCPVSISLFVLLEEV